MPEARLQEASVSGSYSTNPGKTTSRRQLAAFPARNFISGNVFRSRYKRGANWYGKALKGDISVLGRREIRSAEKCDPCSASVHHDIKLTMTSLQLNFDGQHRQNGQSEPQKP